MIHWRLRSLKSRETFEFVQNHDPRHIWIVDLEGMGQTRKGLAAVLSQIGIVNFANESKAHAGFISYPGYDTVYMLTKKLIDENAFQYNHIRAPDRYTSAYLQGSYKGSMVHGQSMFDHKRALQAIGFDEDRTLIITWGAVKLDVGGMARILRNKDQPIKDREGVVLSDKCRTIICFRLFETAGAWISLWV